MKKTENPSYSNNAVEVYNMKDVFDSLVQSKILVWVIAAIFSALISYYLISTQEETKYQSSAVVAIGKYTNLEDEVEFFESRDDIQLNMKSIFIQRLVNDNTKENFASLIKRFGSDLLIFETTAPSKEKSLKSINEMISYIVDNQAKISNDKQRKLVNELDSEYFEYANKLAELKLKEDEIINIDLPSVDNERNTELANIQQKIDRINEIALPSVDNEMKAELTTITIKMQYLGLDGHVASDSLAKNVKTILTVNNVNERINDNTLFYSESLNDEQKIFELESLRESLNYVSVSHDIEKLRLQSQIEGLNELLEYTKALQKLDIERVNNSLKIIKLSEKTLEKKIQDIESRKIFFLNPSNYISPSLKGKIITAEIRGISKPKLILTSIILSFFFSIFLVLFIIILRENIQISKN